MILHCNFEELRALRQGARMVLDAGEGRGSAVAAPPEGRMRVQRLLPRLRGDLTIETLAEQRAVRDAMGVIVECLRDEMVDEVVAAHPGGESAVGAYFAFAHALSVLARVREMGEEMSAMIEVVTGEAPTAAVARNFVFPD